MWIACGPFLSLVDLWHHYAGASWIPWVFLAGLRAVEAPGARRIAVAGLVVALQILAGSADLCAMTLLAVFLHVAILKLDWRAPLGARNLRLLGAAAGALALGIAITAALWMTALELALRTPRASLPEVVRTYWSVHPLGTLEILFPRLWSARALSSTMRATLFESREPFLGSLYLGIPCLALIAGGLALRPSALQKFWLGLGGGAVLFSLGRHFALYEVVVFLIPPLRILRYPVKALILFAFAWALLAGLGYDAWREAHPSDRRRWRLGFLLPLALVALLGLTGALLFRLDPETWGPRLLARRADAPSYATLLASASSPLLSGLGLAMACIVIGMGRLRAPHAKGWAIGLAVLAVGDLALFHRNAIPLASRDLYLYRPPVVDGLRGMGAERLYVYDYTQGDRNRQLLGRPHGHALASVPVGWNMDEALALGMQQTLTPATAGRWALPSGFDIDYRGLQPSPLARLSTVVRDFAPETRLRLLRLGAISHAVTLHTDGFEDLVPAGTWETLLVDPVRVFRVPDPFPRARAVGGVRAADGIEGLELLIDPGFDPAREILLPEGTTTTPSAGPGTARITEERSDRIVLEADLREPAYVVLADAHDPGWQATLDGVTVPVLRANLAFRAVRTPAGQHRIEMVYRPRALIVGMAFSAIAVVAALGLLVRRT